MDSIEGVYWVEDEVAGTEVVVIERRRLENMLCTVMHNARFGMPHLRDVVRMVDEEYAVPISVWPKHKVLTAVANDSTLTELLRQVAAHLGPWVNDLFALYERSDGRVIFPISVTAPDLFSKATERITRGMVHNEDAEILGDAYHLASCTLDWCPVRVRVRAKWDEGT